MLVRKEGFWYSKYEPTLPKPVILENAWTGKEKFLEDLGHAETLAKDVHYRGSSNCRICEQLNGSVEYELDEWAWPAGYAHYIFEHNVYPSLEFRKFIKGKRQ